MKITNVDIDEAQILSEPAPWDGTQVLAAAIATQANSATRAKVGITVNDVGALKARRIVIGARGAAAVPVEFGHQGVPGRKFFKRTIDGFRVL